ncbi:hypothetical protein F8388_017472 [Cannabis sativa]|uniref:CAF1B/HIR1 beta-propeller domain-containing protein n=1 Tax=Cannabis sativa TaxID=3483 RepID=A0A7J6F6U4_CANSA|nr:hypothetical protein F8388_017472 [Cannabis sativa]
MKGGTVQINWHNLKPVLSLDFHPISGALATGGADFEIKVGNFLYRPCNQKLHFYFASYLDSVSLALLFLFSLEFSNLNNHALFSSSSYYSRLQYVSLEFPVCSATEKIEIKGNGLQTSKFRLVAVLGLSEIAIYIYMHIWLINSADPEKKVPTASYQCCLSHHSAAVNVLRFSPSDSPRTNCFWRRWWRAIDMEAASNRNRSNLEASQDIFAHYWMLSLASFHRKDVLDLQWSADGAFLISGSVDNSCLIWDVNKGSVHQILDAHFHYVQGVAWDPLSKYVASLSSDRTCRIYVNKPQTKSKGTEKINYVCQHVIAKAEQQLSDDSKSTKNHLFHDETLPSFFRRLSWSPDGSFLLVPAGISIKLKFDIKILQDFAFSGLFNLPYRLIFAVATLNSLYVYDTESNSPIAVLAGLHYAAITDIAWSSDARYLALSSQDGYCTLVEFENDELGSPILPEPNKMTDDSQSPIQKAEDMAIEATPNDNSVAVNDTTKSEGEKTEVKQTPPASTSTPIVNNKSAKRRITPMAIDP